MAAKPDNSMKWLMIAMIAAILGPIVVLGVQSIFEQQAKAKILTACYQSNRMACVAEYRALQVVEDSQ